MRFAIAMICAAAMHIAYAQARPAPQPGARTANQSVTVQTLQQGMFGYRAIPDLSFPDFIDDLQREDSGRIEALGAEFSEMLRAKVKMPAQPDPKDPNFVESMKKYAAEYTAAAQKLGQDMQQDAIPFALDRVKEAETKYGTNDPRYAAALEDAGLWLMIRDPQAATFMEKAIQLRQAEGEKSPDYWKDLQRRCRMGATQPGTRNPSYCERAFEIRSAQANVTPMELGSRAKMVAEVEAQSGDETKSVEYWERAGEYYKQAGVSPLVLAARFRNLTLAAAVTHDLDHILRLNDLTNSYLELSGAAARKYILPTETLRALAEEAKLPPPESADPARVPYRPADETLTLYAQAEQDIKTGQVLRPIPFDLFTVLSVVGYLVPSRCADTDKGGGNSEAFTALMKSSSALDQKLSYAANNGLANTSIIEHACGPSSPAASIANPVQVPGYATMLRWKGAFAEMVATHQLTVLPGYGEERTEALRALPGAFAQGLTLPPELTNLPPEEQQILSDAPRAKSVDEYLAAHPRADRKTVSRIFDAYQKFRSSGSSKMRDAFKTLQRVAAEEGNPFAFQQMLKPGEVFVDLYKYRAYESDRFGAEHYVAVLNLNGSSHQVQLGAAAPIDAAINQFLSRVGGSRVRGVRSAAASESDSAAAWKAIEQLLVQPIVSALPRGTRSVTLSPDSSLALAPFASLMLDMGVTISVAVVPSVYDFVRLRSAPAAQTPGQALLVGALDYGKAGGSFNPLPGTATEIEKVAELAEDAGFQTATLSGSQATRAAILAKVHDVHVVHLATHGYWSSAKSPNVADAFRSAGVALSLANADSPESRLTAEDILRLDLTNAQLVTLSACASGEGRPVDGQGLLGFQTAFMASGARTVLLSLWSVPDEATSILMQRFYQALWKTPSISKAEALRQAQQQLRADAKFADPRNWAAWVLVGEAW